MKNVISLIVFLFSTILYAQGEFRSDPKIELDIFEPLAFADFAAFTLSDIPGGHTRIFSIRITPAGVPVKMHGIIEWQSDLRGSFRTVHQFWTSTFSSRSFTNLDIGRLDIRIDRSDTDNDLAKDIFDRGKPMGIYRLTIELLDVTENMLDSDVGILSFTNPSQTITITSPEPNSTQDIGSVILQWNNIVGATSYEILANVRKYENQSLEEALEQGAPIIDHVDVGSLSTINLRNYFTREPLPGQEIVAQVIAVIPGPAGGERLKSDIINFYIGTTSSPEIEAMRARMISILSTILGQEGVEFLEMLRNGEIDLQSLVVADESGKRISTQEFELLLSYLQANPDAIIDVRFQEQ